MFEEKKKKKPFAHRPETVLALNSKDVELVTRHARYVFVVDEDGSPRCFWENPNAKLEVIAVLGEGKKGALNLGTTILLEIGMRRTRPYHQARFSSTGEWMTRRRKYARLSELQLRNLWPHLEELLLSITRARVAIWKCDPVEVRTQYQFAGLRNRYGGESVRRSKKMRVIPRGIRFTVSFHDPLVIASVLQSECRRRLTNLKADLDGARSYLVRRINQYAVTTFSSKKRLRALAGNPQSLLGTCLEFLERRQFLPHQLHLLREGMTEFEKYAFDKMLIHMGVGDADRELMELWERLLNESVPVFSEGYVWCIPLHRQAATERKKYSVTKRKWLTGRSKRQDYLVFEYTLEESVPS